MATNEKKKKLKEAKKQLIASNAAVEEQYNDSSPITQLKERIEEIKQVVNTNQKREYSNIDDGVIPYSLASEYIPLKQIKRGIIETTDGRFVKILQIMPVNYNLKSPMEKKRIIGAFEQYLRVAPSHIQIKCISRQSSIRKLINNIDFDKANEKHKSALEFYDDQKKFITEIARGESISRDFYMIVEYVPETKMAQYDFNAAKRQLDDVEVTARKYLSRCGNKVYDFTESSSQEQASVIYRILNRNRSLNIPYEVHREDFQDRWLETSSKNTDIDNINIREYVSPKEIDFRNNKYVVIDGVYMSAIAIASNGYVEHVHDAWVSRFTNLGEGIDVDFHIQKEERHRMSENIYRTSKFKGLRLADAESGGDESDKVESLSSSVESAKYIRAGLRAGQDFFWVNTIIYISANSEESWAYKTKEVQKLLHSWEFKVNTLTNMQEDAFFSYMPFCHLNKAIFNVTKQNVISEGLTTFYPFTSYEMSAEDGILFGIAEDNNSLATLDIFDTKIYSNANACILGTSGVGKTYLLMLLALRQRLKHIPICIIAPEKGFEFGRLCEKLGGSFISINPSSNKCINIMEIREKDLEASRYLDGEVIESSLLVEKVQSLLTFFSIVIPDITYEEKQLLDDAIVNTYYDFKIFQNNKSLYNPDGTKKKMPILGDLYKRLEGKEETKRIATIVRRLVFGSAKNFNQQTNVDLSNEFTVIDVSKLTGDMLLVGMYIALDYVWSKAKEDRTVKKTIIIDEMWKLLGASSNAMAAQYVLEIYKTIRGYGGSVIGATQNLSDFTALENGKYGRGIINNAETKMVLKLKADEIKELQESLGLTDEERDKVLTLEHQAMLIANNNNIVVNVKASNLEHRYVTTDRKELAKIKVENMELMEEY